MSHLPIAHQHNFVALVFTLSVRAGKKDALVPLFLAAFRILKRRRFSDPLRLVAVATGSLSYPIALKTKQVAGSKVHIPWHCPVRQQRARAIVWLVEGARNRDRFTKLTASNLADEVIQTAQGHSTHARRQLVDLLRQIVDNRPSLRFG